MYAQAYEAGRRYADRKEFSPDLTALRRRGLSDADAIAFARGFYHRRTEIDPLHAADGIADIVRAAGLPCA